MKNDKEVIFNMNLFDLIPANEKTMMEDYIDAYSLPEGYQRQASLEKIMHYWNDRKDSYLYRMLGNNFIVEKPFTVRDSVRAISERMFNVVTKHNKFISRFESALYDLTKVRSNTPNWVLKQMTLVDVLAKNRIANEFVIEAFNPNREVKKFSAQKNSKVVPLIGKIAKWIGIDEGYEEFRIDHSMALNTAKLEGTLCLSIHPLDYMTMSDNESNWDSCMSWKKKGCYRSGTVEMMNSEMVVVGYFKSDNKTMTMPGGGEWNSKKWRELFIVNPELIMNIKAYPYESDELTLGCLNWIRELVEKNIGWTNFQAEYGNWNPDYDDKWAFGGYDYVSFETNYMYNDINEAYTRHFYYVTCGNHENDHLYCNYSGEFVCMCCGDAGYLDEGDEGSLICEDCTPTKYYCDSCGEWEYDLDDLHRVGDCYYCDNCYDDLYNNPFYEYGDEEEEKLTDALGIAIINRETGDNYRFFVDSHRFYHDLNEYFKDFASTVHYFRTHYSGRSYSYSEGFAIYYEDLTERGRKIVDEYGERVIVDWRSLLSQELTTALVSNSTDKIVKIDNNFNSADEATNYSRDYEYSKDHHSDTMYYDYVIRLDS